MPEQANKIVEAVRKVKIIKAHSIQFPEITNGDNFFFPTPESLDNFIDDLSFGSDWIDEVDSNLRLYRSIYVV